MITKFISKSEDYQWPNHGNRVYDFGLVDVECNQNSISVYSDYHELEFYGSWNMLGVYKHNKSKKPNKLTITVRHSPLGHTTAIIDVDLTRRFRVKKDRMRITWPHSNVIASSQAIDTVCPDVKKFGRMSIEWSKGCLSIIDRFVEVEAYGDWEIRGTFVSDEHKVPVKIFVDVFEGDDVSPQYLAYLVFRLKKD